VSRRGVTLLETLVALALTALLLGTLSRSLAGAARSRAAAGAESDRLAAARTVLLRLAAEIEAAVGEKAIELEPGLGPGSSSRLRVTTTVRTDATIFPASDRRTVSYEVDGAAGTLLRRERTAPPSADAPEPEALAVLAGVARLAVRCSDGTEWRGRWQSTALPRAVELVLAVDDGAGGAEELATTVGVALGGR
jgi:prepilin-type N-terminal cleavage/methylation domain-containing protein